MFKVEAHFRSGSGSHDSECMDVEFVQSFIALMIKQDFCSHFVVTGPEWSCIVRPK